MGKDGLGIGGDAQGWRARGGLAGGVALVANARVFMRATREHAANEFRHLFLF